MDCTVRGIFQQHFETYATERRLPLHVHRVAYWISRCRTAELGGHVRRCPAGHIEQAFYNSCHQRSCPQCQALASEQWLERQRARLLACEHHHLIFTIAHDLNPLWCWNRAAMAKVLFDAVRAVLNELLLDPKYLGAQPAYLAALHTWGRSLSLHPHIHVLAANGGLNDQGVWVKPRRSHFLPARVLMHLFRGKFLAMLREQLEQGHLKRPPDLSLERARSLLNRLGRKKWNVHIRARYGHGEGVAMYLARYLKGGPLKNTQLVSVNANRVCFRYTPHQDEADAGGESHLMSLTPKAFLDRYVAHIAPPRLQCVRGYGLYGHRKTACLDQARASLGQAPVEQAQDEPISPTQFIERFANTPNASRCPQCNALLRFYRALTSTRNHDPPTAAH